MDYYQTLTPKNVKSMLTGRQISRPPPPYIHLYIQLAD